MQKSILKKLTPELLNQAKTYFLSLGRSDFLQKSPQSLVSRYLISQCPLFGRGIPTCREGDFQKDSVAFIPEDHIFHHGKYRFSSSHSADLIAIVISDSKIAIDCEKIKSKSIEFYQTRVAKECLVKFLDLSLDEHEKMTVSLGENLAEVVYKGVKYGVKIWDKDGFAFGIL